MSTDMPPNPGTGPSGTIITKINEIVVARTDGHLSDTPDSRIMQLVSQQNPRTERCRAVSPEVRLAR